MKTLYNRFILGIILLSTAYGAYSVYNMMWNNLTPYTLSAEGIILQKDKIYAVSNTDHVSKDTIFLHFEHAKELMPQTLCYIAYNKNSRSFVTVNADSIADTESKQGINYLLPFCRTYNLPFYKKPVYFKSKEVISESVMLSTGIKYNISGGDKDSRVTLEFIKCKRGVALKLKDDGIKTNYLVKKDTTNTFEVCFNRQPESNNKFVFAFDNTTKDTSAYIIEIHPHRTYAETAITNQINKKKKKENNFSSITQLEAGSVIFELKKRYPLRFMLIYMVFFSVIMLFQIVLYKRLTACVNPLVSSFISIRILMNAIVFTGIPVFLHSVIYHDNRCLYLLLVLILNFTLLLKGKRFQLLELNKYDIVLKIVFGLLLLIAPFILHQYSNNESFFGVPVLHIQKLLLMMIYFIVSKIKRIKKAIISIVYCLFISIFTDDFGSSIYTLLAFLLIEYLYKTISAKRIILFLIIGTIAILFYFKLNPEELAAAKYYRIAAPFIQPESDILKYASEPDRESVAIHLLNLKNIFSQNTPLFNEVMFPANLKSTMHSDYVFNASLLLGNLYFLTIYLLITATLLYNILFILYCTLYNFRISETEVFEFPKDHWSDMAVFLLAITFVSFIYPVLSNLQIIPVTGQSIPLLSTSWVEVLFIIFLMITLENIFKNTPYTNTDNYKYTVLGFADLLGYIRKDNKVITGCVVIMILLKSIGIIYFTNPKQRWTKDIPMNQIEIKDVLTQKSQFKRSELLELIKVVTNDNPIIAVENKKKALLKNINCLFYAGKPYYIVNPENKEFKKDIQKCLSQVSVNKIFNEHKEEISGTIKPFGVAYSIDQQINGKNNTIFTNKLYSGCKEDGDSINTDLHAECNYLLKLHVEEIGNLKNIGSVMIVENRSGNIITSASYPLSNTQNANTKYYLIGSLKKSILAYAALAINEEYKYFKVNKCTFSKFIQNSDDEFSACLLKDILINEKNKFDEILSNDFDLPLFAYNIKDAFFDTYPSENEFKKDLNKNNSIYRISIGQQKPYQFKDVVQWYARMASNKKIYLNASEKFSDMSLSNNTYQFFRKSMNSVLYGTANDVGINLSGSGINLEQFIAKTGTAEHTSGKYNNSSSFIIANSSYTIAIMLNGKLPYNDKNLSAKVLFIKLIPTLLKYNILERN
jgi:hypothetical protein